MAFVDELVQGLESTPKQEFKEAKVEIPAAGNPENTESSENSAENAENTFDSADDDESKYRNPAPEDEIKTEAEVWVELGDFALSRGLAFWADEDVERYKVKPDEKKTLINALTRYFKTLPKTPPLPGWVFFLVVFLIVYGPKVSDANKKRKEKKKKKAAEQPKPDAKKPPQYTPPDPPKSPPPVQKNDNEEVYTETGKTENGVIIFEKEKEQKEQKESVKAENIES